MTISTSCAKVSTFGSLIKNSLIYGLGQILSRFIGFLLLPLFTAYLTPNDYGIIAILGIMNLVITSIFSLGFGAVTGLCYFDGDDPLRKAETIWTSLLILAMSVAVLGVIAFILPERISIVLFKTPDYARLVALSILSAGVIILNMQVMLYLMFEKKAVPYVAVSSFVTILALGLSIVTVVFLGRGVAGMIESLLVANATGLFLLLPFILRLPFRLNRTIFEELLRFGMPLIPSSIFLFVLQQSNQYILQRIRGLDEAGVYLIGFNFGLIMNVLVSAFSSAWYPHFMSFMNRQVEAQATFDRIATAYILGFGVISLLFYTMAKPVVMIMTQLPFHDAYKIVGLAATAYFLSGFFIMLLPAVYFAKEVKYVSVIQGISAVIATLLNFLLIPWLGMAGAALSLVLGYLTLVLLQIFWNFNRRRYYLQIRYEWKRIVQFLVPYVCLAALALWPRNLGLTHELAYSGLLTMGSLSLLFLFMTAGEKRFIFSNLSRLRRILP